MDLYLVVVGKKTEIEIRDSKSFARASFCFFFFLLAFVSHVYFSQKRRARTQTLGGSAEPPPSPSPPPRPADLPKFSVIVSVAAPLAQGQSRIGLSSALVFPSIGIVFRRAISSAEESFIVSLRVCWLCSSRVRDYIRVVSRFRNRASKRIRAIANGGFQKFRFRGEVSVKYGLFRVNRWICEVHRCAQVDIHTTRETATSAFSSRRRKQQEGAREKVRFTTAAPVSQVIIIHSQVLLYLYTCLNLRKELLMKNSGFLALIPLYSLQFSLDTAAIRDRSSIY